MSAAVARNNPWNIDISPDRTRFLMIESESSGPGLVAVPNWLTELTQSTSTKKP